jgi:PAS domain-containing protein
VVALFAAAAGILRIGPAPAVQADKGAEAQAFLQNMAEGVLLAQVDGSPRWANSAFIKLSGAGNERDLHFD